MAKIRASIAERVPELLAALMTKALDGDTGAARLLLERAIAPLRATEQTQAMVLPDGTLTQQGRAVLAPLNDRSLENSPAAMCLLEPATFLRS